MAQETRKRYSSDPQLRARELVAEGRIGGPRPGAGRPRKQPTSPPNHRRPAAAAIAEAARENADLIAQVFADVLADDSISDHQKVNAMRTWINIESKETDREREEGQLAAERELAELSRAEVEDELARTLSNPLIRGALQAALDAPSG